MINTLSLSLARSLTLSASGTTHSSLLLDHVDLAVGDGHHERRLRERHCEREREQEQVNDENTARRGENGEKRRQSTGKGGFSRRASGSKVEG